MKGQVIGFTGWPWQANRCFKFCFRLRCIVTAEIHSLAYFGDAVSVGLARLARHQCDKTR